MTPPNNTTTFLQNLARITLTPVTIRRIFLLLTRLHYSTPDNYGVLKPKFERYVWHKETKLSTVHVEFDYKYNPAALDDRPSIWVGLDDINFKKVVLNNEGKPTETRSGQGSIKVASTAIIVRHVSKSADEVLALADLSCQFFMGIQPMIRDALGQLVLEYDVMTCKSSRPFEKTSQQADQHFVSDLIIAFSYNHTWMTEFESHRIKTITFKQSIDSLSANE